MPGVLEDIASQYQAVAQAISDLTAEVRASAPQPVCPLTEDEEMWCDGALTVKQAAAFCGISRSSLYEAMRSDGLSSVMIKGCRLIPKRALIRWMAKHQEQAITAREPLT